MTDDKIHTVVIIGNFAKGSGNNTTANRIREYLLESGFRCKLQESDGFESVASLCQFLDENHVSCVFGIHGKHAGKLLRGVAIPYCLLLAGTDINEYSRDERDWAIMSEAIDRARVLVTFSNTLAVKTISLWPQAEKKTVNVVLQGAPHCYLGFGVKTEPSVVADLMSWKSEHGLPLEGHMFILVAGLRPVKDSLYLVSAFSNWRQAKNLNVHFVLVGPKLDRKYSALVLHTIADLPGVRYVNEMSLPDTHRLIAHSFALVNSSLSEGMSTAILEAMDLGVPVIARNIPGNAAVVEASHTGLLYDNPEEFIESCESLLNDVALYEMLSVNARCKIRTFHSLETEKQQYYHIVRRLVNGISNCR